jgi:hypothetical protein
MNHTPLEVPDSTAGAVTDDEGDRPSLPKTISATLIARISRRQAVILSLVVVGAIAIAVGVGVGVGGQGKNSTPPSSSMCDFAGQVQPNIFRQCQCFATVNTISPPLSQSYHSLLTSLVPQVIPDFQDSVNSCSAANQALLWLANDTLTTTTTTTMSGLNSSRLTNRLLLALLYTTWGGTGWKQSEGWLSSSDECSWYGVACQSQHVVTQLSLDHNNLTSIVPTELFELTGLGELYLRVFVSDPSNRFPR